MKCRVYDGIAGSGKSTIIDAYYKEKGIIYERETSTNQLARSTEARFGVPAFTIAGRLFKTVDGRFFAEERRPECKQIVIDEILQVDPKVFEWVKNHMWDYDITICTDTKQMLVPNFGEKAIKAFEDFIHYSDVDYYHFSETKRAYNEETRAIYNLLYKNIDTEEIDVREFLKQFPKVDYNEVRYTPKNGYITHTKAIEEYIYNDLNIALEAKNFNTKGFLSAYRPEDLDISKYPILSQQRAEQTHAKSYLQADNIGTPTRWQGSEVDYGQKLYYFINQNSIITPRELYTVITRLHDINDFRVVVVDSPKIEFFTFNNKPVRREATMVVDNEPKNSTDWDNIFKEAEQKTENNDRFSYSKKMVCCNGKKVYRLKPQKDGMSIQALVAKDDKAFINYTPEIYKILEEHGLDRLQSAQIKNNRMMSKDTRYSLDLFSAFLSILSKEASPSAGKLYKHYREDKLNFFKIESPVLLHNICVGEEKLAQYIVNNELGTAEFLFSTDYVDGFKFAQLGLKKATKTVEDKAKTKTLHWGILEREYLTGHKKRFSADTDFYIINEKNMYKLIMTCLDSFITLMWLSFSKDITGNKAFCVDEIRFNTDDIDADIERFEKMFPGYCFRVKDNDCLESEPTGCEDFEDFCNLNINTLKWHPTTIYQNYEDLKTKEERRKAMEAERKRKARAQMTDEQRKEENRKRNERRKKIKK